MLVCERLSEGEEGREAGDIPSTVEGTTRNARARGSHALPDVSTPTPRSTLYGRCGKESTNNY